MLVGVLSGLLASGLARLLAGTGVGTLDGSAELVYDLVELLQLLVEGLDAVVSELGSGSGESVDELLSHLLGDLGAVLIEGALGVVDNIVELVSDFNGFLK